MSSKFGKVQKLGKALMLPVAVLPIASLLLRLGAPDILNIPFIMKSGDAIFANLALIFAIGIAIGLAKNNHGAAGLAGVVSYYVMLAGATSINDKINMGVLAGIIAGLIGGLAYNKFHKTKLPDWLAFFGGKRFVPIISSLIAMGFGLLFGFIWPPIQTAIDAFAYWIIDLGSIGTFLFGTANRLLIPTGLHHVLNNVVWFLFGEYNGATGDLGRFFAGDPTAGMFMAGFFPMMMFGLPAAALAMYHTARKENRSAIGGALFSVAFTAFLTGITEPIEFMFMFLAPVLYVVHALLTGISMAVCHALGVLHGFGFSAGAIDYFLNLGLATKGLLILPIGVVTFVIYYSVFVFVIKKQDLQTPGRGADESGLGIDAILKEKSMRDLAMDYISVLGGNANIENIDACITRLRLTLVDNSIVDEKALKALGSAGSIRPNGKNIQVIIGPKAEILADEMKDLA